MPPANAQKNQKEPLCGLGSEATRSGGAPRTSSVFWGNQAAPLFTPQASVAAHLGLAEIAILFCVDAVGSLAPLTGLTFRGVEVWLEAGAGSLHQR